LAMIHDISIIFWLWLNPTNEGLSSYYHFYDPPNCPVGGVLLIPTKKLLNQIDYSFSSILLAIQIVFFC